MRRFLQLRIAIALLTYILLSSCSTNTKKQPEIVKNSGQESFNSDVVDSSIFFKGEVIFKADCNTKCHVAKRNLDNYLEGVVQRVGDDYLKLYLTKQDSLISAKDSNALMGKASI